MGERGKSKLWPVLVAINEALKTPWNPASGPVALEQCWEQIDQAKQTGQIKADVRAIRAQLEEASDDQLGAQLAQLAMLSGLKPEDLRKIVRRRTRRLGLVSDEERVTEYCARVAREYMHADFRGIAQQTAFVSMPLDEVFVPLSAAPEEVTREATEEERGLIEELERAGDARERAELERRLSETGMRGFLRGVGERAAPMTEVVQRNRKVVVLGDPGSGKTTLVKWLARQCALGSEAMAEKLGWGEDVVPVVVPIAGYGKALEDDESVRLHEHIGTELDRDEGEGFGDLMLERMKDGECLVLLDGLDEIPDPGRRLAAARGVGELMARCPECRYVVTSRIVGYSLCRVTGDVSHYVLRGFEDDDIRQFARQWCEAYEKASHPEAVDLERARREAEELTEAIFDKAHPQVVEFARNPLLLTILALIKQTRVQLPERRVQLYEVALNTLMESWVRGRSLARGAKGVELDVGQSVRVWQRVAYWMHREKPAGTAHRSELIEKLKAALVEEMGVSEREAEETAESFLTAAAERTGLLQARGENVFGFLHQTFEEYLTAMHIASPAHTAFERAAPHLHDSRWREVILLTAGYIGAVLRQPELAGMFVDSMRKAGSKYEEILHRDLLLASECLAERTPLDRRCEQRILGDVCDLATSGDVGASLRHDMARVLEGMVELRPSGENVSKVRGVFELDDAELRCSVARMMANTREESAGAALREGLSDEQRDVAGRTAAALLTRGEMGDEVLAALIDWLSGTWPEAASTVRRAASAGPGRDSLREALLARLPAGALAEQAAAAAALAALGCDDEVVATRLGEARARGDEGVRKVAMNGLVRMRVQRAQVRSQLIEALRDEDGEVRWRAIRALRPLAGGDEEVRASIEIGLDDEHPLVQAAAAETLLLARTSTERASRTLEELLESKQVLVRLVALSEALVSSALNSWRGKDVLTVARSLLEDSDRFVRMMAASFLAGARPRSEEVKRFFLAGLADPREAMRAGCARILGMIGAAGGEAAEAVEGVARALVDESAEVRASAAEALEGLVPLPEDVLERVRGLLGDEDADVRYWAARVLVQEEERGGRVGPGQDPSLRSG